MDNSVAVPYEQSVLEMQEGLVQKCDAVVVDSQCSRPMLLPPLQLGLRREMREVGDEGQAIPIPRVCILIHEAHVTCEGEGGRETERERERERKRGREERECEDSTS